MARLSSLAFSAALVAGLFTVVAWLNARAVKQIDAQIAELEQSALVIVGLARVSS